MRASEWQLTLTLTLRLGSGLRLRLRMKIRPAERDDLPGILEIYNEAVLNTTASYDYEPRTLEHRIAWYDDHVKNNYPVFVAVNDRSQVVGWSALNRFHERTGYRLTAENSVHVAADPRG